jgi:hypothetical protein
MSQTESVARASATLYTAVSQIMRSDRHFKERLREAWTTLRPLEPASSLPAELREDFDTIAEKIRTPAALYGVDSFEAAAITDRLLSLYTRVVRLEASS